MNHLKGILAKLKDEESLASHPCSAAMKDALMYHGLLPLAHFRDLSLPERDKCFLYSNLASHMAREKLLWELDARLVEHGLSLVVLKGASLAYRYWPRPQLRPSCDLDFLVPEDCGESLARIFEDLGYHLVERNTKGEKWVNSCKGLPPIDLLRALRAEDALNPTFRLSVDSVFSEQEKALPFKGIHSMSVEHLLLHCCVHAADHAFSRFIWLLDIALVLDNYPREKSFSDLLELARLSRAKKALLLALHLTKDLFGLDGRMSTPELPLTTRWFHSKLMREGASWGDPRIGAKTRWLLRLSLVDRPRDFLSPLLQKLGRT